MVGLGKGGVQVDGQQQQFLGRDSPAAVGQLDALAVDLIADGPHDIPPGTGGSLAKPPGFQGSIPLAGGIQHVAQRQIGETVLVPNRAGLLRRAVEAF